MMKIDKNGSGFTLVELLAALVILALLTAIAVPNILGILNKSRSSTYISDAEKMISTAEYQFRKNSKIEIPREDNECIVMGLTFFDNGNFEDAPYGGSYDKDKSFVVIQRQGNNFVYYTRLVEQLKNGSYRGVNLAAVDQLSSENAYSDYVVNFEESKLFDITNDDGNYIDSDEFSDDGIECDSIYVYAPKKY